MSDFMKESNDYPHIPGLPETWNELLDCLKEGEEELERGEAIPWEMVTKGMRRHVTEYVA